MTEGPYQPLEGRTGPGILLRVFLPFALGYFLSYLFRTVNAVIAPDLEAELALDASALGLVTSAYFLTFAAFQLPLGVLLDRFGPRRTEAVLLLLAAIGALVFAGAESSLGLVLGRALIGLGVSACLMAAFKAYVLWFPPERLPLVNGLQMAAGGAGALAATAPVETALQFADWRGLFQALALLTLVTAAVVLLVVPKRGEERPQTSWRRQMGGIAEVFTSPLFWRVAPVTVLTQAGFLSIQSLWTGPWLSDVAGLDRQAVAEHLLVIAAAMIAGFVILGAATERARRFSVAPMSVAVGAMAVFMVLQGTIVFGLVPAPMATWALFGFFGTAGIVPYALLSARFPKELAGRVNTGLNVLVFVLAFAGQWAIGGIIDLWPRTETGGYHPDGFATAFAIVLALQVLALLWFLVRKEPA